MKLTPPKKIVFWIAVALAAVALLSLIGLFAIPFIGAGWLAMIAFVLLALGNSVKGF